MNKAISVGVGFIAGLLLLSCWGSGNNYHNRPCEQKVCVLEQDGTCDCHRDSTLEIKTIEAWPHVVGEDNKSHPPIKHMVVCTCNKGSQK